MIIFSSDVIKAKSKMVHAKSIFYCFFQVSVKLLKMRGKPKVSMKSAFSRGEFKRVMLKILVCNFPSFFIYFGPLECAKSVSEARGTWKIEFACNDFL